jgi:hypothetical protein
MCKYVTQSQAEQLQFPQAGPKVVLLFWFYYLQKSLHRRQRIREHISKKIFVLEVEDPIGEEREQQHGVAKIWRD